MNEKPENLAAAPPDLAAAIRKARLENAERAEAIADLREIETARLSELEAALRPIVEQAPPEVDLFDLALTPGDHPRLFLDMIAFIDMAHDKRTYRFYQDTRSGRVLIAESAKVEPIVAAATNYVARRLVERERALSSDWRAEQAQTDGAEGPKAWPIASGPAREPRLALARAHEAVRLASPEPEAKQRRRFLSILGRAFSVLLMLIGAVTLAFFLGVAAYFAWTLWARDLWAHWIGPAPF